MDNNQNSNFSFEEINLNLRDFLKEGNKIKTKFVTHSDWTQNTIFSVETDTFEIGIKVAYIVNNISNDDVLEFKYIFEDFEYLLRGTVEEINLNFGTIVIRIYSIQRIKNRRLHTRFDVSLCCYVIPEAGEKHYYGVTQNISQGGISLQTKAVMEIGHVFGLNIYLSKDRIISFAVKILRKKASGSDFIYDTTIESINRKSEAYFKELCEVLEKFDDELYFKYINSLNKNKSK
ncbi:MAG: PilZ domain-containing protein [Deltaproteobacteria bacterium]